MSDESEEEHLIPPFEIATKWAAVHPGVISGFENNVSEDQVITPADNLERENARLRDMLRTHGIVEATPADVELMLQYFPKLTEYYRVDVKNPDIQHLRRGMFIDVAPIQNATHIAWANGEQIQKYGPTEMVARLTRTGQYYWNKAKFP